MSADPHRARERQISFPAELIAVDDRGRAAAQLSWGIVPRSMVNVPATLLRILLST